MTKIKKLPLVNKKTAMIAAFALIIVALVCAYLYKTRDTNSSTISSAPESSQQETINLEPPTQADAERVDENKQSIVNNETKTTQPSPPASGTKSAIPVITYAGQYGQDVEIGAYVNILEDGGNCTATFTKDAAVVTKTVQAVRNANSIDCPVMVAPVSELGKSGMWSVSVSYSSNTASGNSAAQQVEVK